MSPAAEVRCLATGPNLEGGYSGKGLGEIVACKASWGVVIYVG